MATFGQTSNNGNTQTFSADRIYVSTATPASSGTVTAGKGRVWVSAAASPGCRIVIYSDNGGSPNSLLAVSDEIIINNTTEQEITFPFSGVNQISVVSGTPYWFGYMFDDPGTPNFTMSRANTAGVVHFDSVAYPSAPSTFTSDGTAAGPHDCYIEYTTGTNATVSPTVVSIVASIATAAILLGATISPAVQAAVFTTQSPTVNYDKIVSPTVQAASFSTIAPTVITGVPTTANYYFDGSDAGANDPNSVWTNDANAFDGSTSTTASTSTNGSDSSNYLGGEGTNSPTSGDPITQVRARVYGGFGGGSVSAGSYITLSVPSGGWDWDKVASLETRINRSTDIIEGFRVINAHIRPDGFSPNLGTATHTQFLTSNVSIDVAYVEIEVTYLASAGNVTVEPTVQSVTASIPSVTVNTAVSLSPNVQSVTASLPVPTISAEQKVSSAVQSATFSQPTTSVSLGAGFSPDPQSAAISVQTVTVNLDYAVNAAVQSATFTTQTPVVQTNQQIPVNAQSGSFSVIPPNVVIQTDAVIQPIALSITANLPVSSVSTGVGISVTSQVLTFSLQTSDVSVSANIQTGNPIGLLLALTYELSTNVSVNTQSATFSLPVPTVTAIKNVQVSSTAQSAAFAVQSATVQISSIVSIEVQTFAFSLQLPHRVGGFYTDKYQGRNTTFADKYNQQNTNYADKYSNRNTDYSDKYTIRDTDYDDKYSDQNTTYNDKFTPLNL